jgi:hypothetical protein
VRTLTVERRDLFFALSNRVPGVANFLDTETGDVVPVFTYNREIILAAVKQSPGRYVRLAPQSGSQAYEAMVAFCRTVSQPELRAELEQAVAAPGRFRAFRTALEAHPAEAARWQNFRAAAMTQHLSERLLRQGIELRFRPTAD